ncbi:hypothetical protein L1I79_35690, partial [Strepomyces sp. STD 3.1]|nr:hypothetical protein [Streptomyces sp. STD 3.1]
MGGHSAVGHLKETHDPFKTLPPPQPTPATDTFAPETRTASEGLHEQNRPATQSSAAERVTRIMAGEVGPGQPVHFAPAPAMAPWPAPAGPVHVRMTDTANSMERGLRGVLSDDSLHRSPLRHRVLAALSSWTGTGGADGTGAAPPDAPAPTVTGPGGPEPLEPAGTPEPASANGLAHPDADAEAAGVLGHTAPAGSDGDSSTQGNEDPVPDPAARPRSGTPGTATVTVSSTSPRIHDGASGPGRPGGSGHVPPTRPGASVLETIAED